MHEDIVVYVEKLHKKFLYTYALKGVNLTIRYGEHCLLLGPNGSGKSTLIKLLAGLIKPSKGKVRVLNFNPFKEFSKLKNYIGVVLDDFSLPWWTNGYDYLKHVAIVKKAEWSEVEEIATYLNVTTYWKRLIGTYSAGMKKKIALVQALIGKPKLILLDDPFTALDRKSRRLLIEILKNKSKEATIIVSSHIISGLESVVKKVVVLDEGKVILEEEMNEKLRKIIGKDII